MGAGWLEAVPGTVLALGAVFVPGLLIVLASGGGLVRAVGLAGPVSASVLGVASVAAPVVGWRWSWLPVAAVTVAAVLAGGTGSALLRRRSGAAGRRDGGSSGADGRGFRLALVPALLAAATLLGWNLLQIFQAPEAVSQTADNIFHLNAVRYIEDTGSASSLTVGAAQGDGPRFYPAVWHGAVALVASGGVPAALAVHCVNLAVGALVWPAGVLLLSRLLLGGNAATAFCAGLAAVLFSAYPFLLVDWGVLYPNYYAMALVLPAVAVALELARAVEARLPRRSVQSGSDDRDDAAKPAAVRSAWFALLLAPGLALTHPNALLAALVLVLPLAARTAERSVRSLRGTPRLAAAALAVLLVPAVAAAWTVLRPLAVEEYPNTWQPYQTTAQAAGEFLLTTHALRDAAWVSAAAVAAGAAVLLLRRRERWYLVSYLLAGVLFVFASGVENAPLRTFLTGGWYDDQNRLAAMAAVAAAPLAAAGLTGAVGWVVGVLRRMLPPAPGRRPLAAAGAAGAAAVLAAAWFAAAPTLESTVEMSGREYGMSVDEPLMSAAERDLYEEVADVVPEGTAVAGNPWDGSAWVYFISGRDVVFPHVRTEMTPTRLILAERLNRAAEDPQVCAALRELNVGYAVTSDELIYLPGNPENERFPGIDGLDTAPGFEEVARSGGNALYRITACGP